VRPPGHHAERAEARGFCIYNNIAVAAAHARAVGAARVAIVDYDVHHGNGTQHIFENSPDVLYISTHQFPYYPGTGAVAEIGRGPGEGFTINVPLAVGAVDADYQLVFSDVIAPALRQFKPHLVLVSAGFDAHERDPLGGMRVTAGGFAAMTMELMRVAEECCEGRIAMVTEGGYDFLALAESLRAAISVLSLDRATAPDWPTSGLAPPSRGRTAIAAAKAALGGYWKLP
jgi:acetoin utilization deacetylase AcuC-like enzyme